MIRQETPRATAIRLVHLLANNPQGLSMSAIGWLLFPMERDRVGVRAQLHVAVELAVERHWVTDSWRRWKLTPWGHEEVRLSRAFDNGGAA